MINLNSNLVAEIADFNLVTRIKEGAVFRFKYPILITHKYIIHMEILNEK